MEVNNKFVGVPAEWFFTEVIEIFEQILSFIDIYDYETIMAITLDESAYVYDKENNEVLQIHME